MFFLLLISKLQEVFKLGHIASFVIDTSEAFTGTINNAQKDSTVLALHLCFVD